MSDSQDESARLWDVVADEWIVHADQDASRSAFLMPITLELIGDVSGRRVLDLGCGEGGYGRALAGRGARVVGVDVSPRMIAVARERAAAAALQIDYICANACALGSVPVAPCDVVLASMTLMDVDDYEATIDQVWQVLVAGGALCMSISHPCYSAAGAGWIRGSSGEASHFGVDRYFQRNVWHDFITPWFDKPVIRRHRPLEDVLRPLLRRGFRLRDFREPEPTAEQIAESGPLEHLARVPKFLFMAWQKP
jgi:ubiquinone/menaquinone biosynthesis C-methylase UbiE